MTSYAKQTPERDKAMMLVRRHFNVETKQIVSMSDLIDDIAQALLSSAKPVVAIDMNGNPHEVVVRRTKDGVAAIPGSWIKPHPDARRFRMSDEYTIPISFQDGRGQWGDIPIEECYADIPKSESTAHDQKSSNDPTPSSPSTDKPEYVRRLESEVDYYRSLRKHHPDDPQWKGRDIAERLEKETGAARQTPDHKPQSETWMIIPNKPESKPQSEKTGKRPIASEWMSNLRVDGDWDNYKDYGSLTLSTICVMMQDFAEHYHKAIATDYDAAIKAQEWPNDLGVLVGRTITTRLNGGVPAASPVIRIEKHDVRQSMLRVIMPDSKAVLIRPELRELLSIDPPLETPESGEDVFLPDGMMSVEQRAKNIRAHTSLNDAMLHIVLDDRNWRTALRKERAEVQRLTAALKSKESKQ